MIEQLIRSIRAKISNMLTRAIVLAIKQTDGQMFVQVEGLKDDKHSDVEYRQNYGFRSKPPNGARGILLGYGGDKSNLTFILADNKDIETSPEWEDGESRQFDDTGNARHRIYSGKQELQAESFQFRINDDNVIDFTAGSFKIKVGGEVYEFTSSKLQTTSADVAADTISLQSHLHGGSPTAATGAVSPTQAPIP